MFARVLEFIPRPEKKEEFIDFVKREVLPILKKQPGFLEILPLIPELENERAITICVWTERELLERYEDEVFPMVEEMLKPYLKTPIFFRYYTLETDLCRRCERYENNQKVLHKRRMNLWRRGELTDAVSEKLAADEQRVAGEWKAHQASAHGQTLSTSKASAA